MKTLRLILAAGLLLLVSLEGGAQSKAEKKMYGKTVENFSVKSADKFLKKYPKSVYAPRITQMKDSLLLAEYLEANTTQITPEEALGIAGGEALCALGWKKDGVERVLALDPDLTLRVLSPDGALVEKRSLPVYTMEEGAPQIQLTIPMEMIAPLGGSQNFIHFGYRNGDREYVEALYLPAEDNIYQALFYGNPLGGGRIEGQSPEMLEGTIPPAEVAWIVNRFKENPDLVPLSKADLLTDESIHWWLGKNPKADTASRLTFGRLDPESSMALACKAAKKEKGKNVSVAQFDIRGYTVICSVSRAGEYALVWCEPVCKNKKTDRYIRSIYFENDGITLDVIYYKGKTTFKNKISLNNQTISHLK
jgi:hypothetical protein